ncbi:TonB-dependent siderophore receptor [Novosphingobium decolorationis]|uniref:TonB-dependent siderophore receptor n=2 Tax=Novosphingobium decolorationis TaxID=2698673 RepID=A0ABX8EAS5_9SPHN|nr:TonB-dependent siderophore receptor [Novosphingobium decolorationis]
MFSGNKATSASLTALAIALGGAQVAHADAAPGASAPPTIVVTGQRTEDTPSYTAEETSISIGLPISPRETPQTVTVITRQLLDDQQIETIDDVLATAPGITSYQNDNAGRTTYRARGFDVSNYRIDGMQVDGQSNFSGGGASTNMDLYDSVQIVRGANGLLGGTGDPSATIYLQRKQPGTELGANGSLVLGNWDKRRVMGDLNAPITADGNVRGRLVFSDESTDTFREREHVDRRAILANFAANLTPTTVLNAGVQYERTVNKGSSWGSNVSIWFADGTLANLPRSTNPVADWSESRRKATTAFVNLDHRFANDWHVKLGYARTDSSAYNNLGVAKINNAAREVGGYAGFWNQDGSGAYLNAMHSEFSEDRDNVAVTLNGPLHLFGREHQLMFGFNGFWSESTSWTFDNALGNCNIAGVSPFRGCQYRSAGLPIDDWRSWDGSYANFQTFRTDARGIDRTRSIGGYAAGRFELADGLTAIVGARISDYKTSGGDYDIANVYTADAETTHEKGVFTPYAGLVYDVTDTLSVYASYTDVFTPQGNLRDEDDRLLPPVTGSSYEAGIKGAFYGGKLNTSLAFYRNEQSNVAENTGELNDVTGLDIYRTVDGVVSKGVDFDASGELLPGWNVFFGYSYLDVKGLSYQRDPHSQLRLSTSYTLPGALNRLTIGGGITAQSKTEWSTNPGRPLGDGTYDDSNLDVSGYTLVNLMARFQATQNIQISANVTNLTDKTYYRQFGFYDGLIYGEPRSYSVTLRAKL